MVPQREMSRSSVSRVGPLVDTKKSREVVTASQDLAVKDSDMQLKDMATVVKETQEDASITPPSLSGTISKNFDENLNPFDMHKDQMKSNTDCKGSNALSLLHSESQPIDGQKKVQFAIASSATSQGNVSLILLDLLVSSSIYLRHVLCDTTIF